MKRRSKSINPNVEFVDLIIHPEIVVDCGGKLPDKKDANAKPQKKSRAKPTRKKSKDE